VEEGALEGSAAASTPAMVRANAASARHGSCSCRHSTPKPAATNGLRADSRMSRRAPSCCIAASQQQSPITIPSMDDNTSHPAACHCVDNLRSRGGVRSATQLVRTDVFQLCVCSRYTARLSIEWRTLHTQSCCILPLQTVQACSYRLGFGARERTHREQSAADPPLAATATVTNATEAMQHLKRLSENGPPFQCVSHRVRPSAPTPGATAAAATPSSARMLMALARPATLERCRAVSGRRVVRGRWW
jgi:hypothetical protein